VFLHGEGIKARSPQGEQIVDDTFYLLFNAHHEDVDFKIPQENWGQAWCKVLNTADVVAEEKEELVGAGQEVAIDARSVMILKRVN
jgi:glycogen operon protein